MSSTSSVQQVKTIAARLRAYTSPTSVTLALLSGAKVYERSAPPDPAFPHIVVRKVNEFIGGDFGLVHEQFDVEAICYGKSRDKEEEVWAMSDLVIQALLTWREASSAAGLTFGASVRRDPISSDQSPADSTIVAVRVLIDCTSWPAFLTALSR